MNKADVTFDQAELDVVGERRELTGRPSLGDEEERSKASRGMLARMTRRIQLMYLWRKRRAMKRRCWRMWTWLTLTNSVELAADIPIGEALVCGEIVG